MQLSLHGLGGALPHKVRHEQHATALESGSDRIGDAALCHPLDRQLPSLARSPAEWVDVGSSGEICLHGSYYDRVLIDGVQSGLCACVINISQFYIINEAGAVSSTVVGHVKTVSIVTLGWIAGGNTAADGSVVGFLLAIAGIIT